MGDTDGGGSTTGGGGVVDGQVHQAPVGNSGALGGPKPTSGVLRVVYRLRRGRQEQKTVV